MGPYVTDREHAQSIWSATPLTPENRWEIVAQVCLWKVGPRGCLFPFAVDHYVSFVPVFAALGAREGANVCATAAIHPKTYANGQPVAVPVAVTLASGADGLLIFGVKCCPTQ